LAKIPEYRDKWLKIGKDTTPITLDIARPIINDLYVHILKQKEPLIIIMDNPISTWYATFLNSQISSQIGSQINSQIYSQIGSQIRSQILSQIRSQIDSQISSHISSHISSQIDSQINSQINSQISSQINSQIYSQISSQINSQIYSQIDSQIRSQINSQIGSQIDSQIGSQIYSQIYSQIRSQIYSQIGSQIRSQIDSQIGSQIYSQIYSQIRSQIRSQIDSQIDLFVWPYLDGQFWASYFGYYEFIFNELLTCDNSLYKYFLATANLHLIYPLENICILCQKPKLISMSNGMLHNEKGPSVAYDGFNVYSLNGVRVPDWLVLTRDTEIDPLRIKELKNAEHRREFVRKIGYERIYHKLGGKTLDTKELFISNGESMFRHHYEVIRLNIDGGWTFLKMTNPSLSTIDNEVYHIEGVPNDCDTFEKAWAFRKPPKMRQIPVSKQGEDYYQQGDVILWPKDARLLKEYPVILT